MQLTAEHQKQFCHLLSAEIQCAENMRLLLNQEKEALTSRSVDRIETATKNKDVLKNKMQRHLIHRDRFLKAMGFPPGNTGTQRIVDQFSNSEVERLWGQLLSLAKELKELNEINGGIVNLSLKHQKVALRILTGQNDEQDTYGPGGHSRRGTLHHTLAKA